MFLYFYYPKQQLLNWECSFHSLILLPMSSLDAFITRLKLLWNDVGINQTLLLSFPSLSQHNALYRNHYMWMGNSSKVTHKYEDRITRMHSSSNFINSQWEIPSKKCFIRCGISHIISIRFLRAITSEEISVYAVNV